MPPAAPNAAHNRQPNASKSPSASQFTAPTKEGPQPVRPAALPSKSTAKPTLSPPAPERCHRTVYVVFGSLLLDLLAFTMILPLLPALLEHYRLADGNSGLYHQLAQSVRYFQEAVGAPERYTSVLFGGVLGSMYSFLQFAASPIVGGLSDVLGRKPMMVVCLVSGSSTLERSERLIICDCLLARRWASPPRTRSGRGRTTLPCS